ncbi:unnamed protein product [Ambrosiozyma monospora]|uniref:Unnamed protein product n=1 Tax=Ambrosiozyma monospora TaxID=43982 RepID=A0ACB5UCP8_AMBMO|nr:unnamed protein product [Ambrosiozyma monospora]
MMHNTCLIAEKALPYYASFQDLTVATPKPCSINETIANAAVSSAFEQNAKMIIVLSTSGNTARLVSKYRPNCPIFMVTRNERAARFSHLYRGVYPFVFSGKKDTDWATDVEQRIEHATKEGIKLGFVRRGEPIIVITGQTGGIGHSNTMRVLQA